MAKKNYHHGNLREALVAAGLEILEADGLPALSLRAIAARAGVSHAAPKNHFGSLRGLLTAIGAEGFRRHAAFMRQGLAPDAPRPERRQVALAGYVAFARAHPALFQMMFAKLYCDFTDPELSAAARESYAVLADIAQDLNWDKSTTPEAQTKAEMLLWSLAHGYAMLALNDQFLEDASGAPRFRIADISPAFGDREA